LYTRVLEMLPDGSEERFDLLAARAAAYDISLDREAQLADIEAMLHLAEAGEDKIRQIDALLALGNLNLEVDKFKVKEPAEQALEIAREIGDKGREARAAFLMYQDRVEYSDVIPAQQYLKKAVELTRSAGLHRELAEYISHSNITFNIDDDDTRLATQLEALALSQEIGDKRLEMMVTQNLAELYCNIKKPNEALPIAEAVLQLSSEIGDIDCRLNALYSLGSTKLHLGRLEEAETHCLEILQDPGIFRSHLYWAVIQVIRHVYLSMGEYEKNLNLTADLLKKARREDAGEYWLSELGYFHGIHFCVLGKYQEALETFEKGVSFMEKANEPGQAAVALGIMAHYAAMLGDLDLAQDYLEQAFRYCSGLEESLNYAFVLNLSAEVMIMDGRPDAVKLGLKQQSLGLEIKQKLQIPHIWSEHFILADLLMALVPEDPSYTAEALITIEKAIGVYKEKQFGWSPPECLFITASQVYRVNQQPQKADEYLRRAYERLMLAESNIKDDDLRSSFLENVRWNREILAEAKTYGIAP